MYSADPYRVLGLLPDADEKAIKKAYRSLMQKYHPDKSKEIDSLEMSKKINAAYEELVKKPQGFGRAEDDFVEFDIEESPLADYFMRLGEEVPQTIKVGFGVGGQQWGIHEFDYHSLRKSIGPICERFGKSSYIEEHYDRLFETVYMAERANLPLQADTSQGSSEPGAYTVARIDESILFQDPAFELLARIHMDKLEGSVLQSDADSVAELDLSVPDLASIEDLRHFRYLHTLDLSFAEFEDARPLSLLEGLKELYLANWYYFDMESIGQQTGLEVLDISGNGITELGGIERLRNLRRLDVSMNPLRDISALCSLPKLQYVNLNGTHTEDFSPLLRMPSLAFVDVSDVSDTVLQGWNPVWEQLEAKGVLVKKYPD